MSLSFFANTARSLKLEVVPAGAVERIEVLGQEGTSDFVRTEHFDVLPPRLWLSHRRAVALGKLATSPHNPTPELDIGSAR